MCVQLPSRRQILAKLEAEKQALADLKKDPIALDPDAESLARLKALKGEAERPLTAQVPVRTAQVCSAWCYQATEAFGLQSTGSPKCRA